MNYILMTHKEVFHYARETGIPMAWPAVVAETDEGQFKGILATESRDDAVVAGPIIASSSKVALRLIEKYTEVLSGIGITLFLFSINRTMDRWLRAVRRSGYAEEWKTTETAVWFRKRIEPWQ